MPANESVIIRPARNVLGSIRVPGDKSISHRYAMLAALAPGRSRFENYSPGADCNSTLGCVRALGCTVERDEKGAVVIDGIGPQLHAPSSALDCGNSGSTMRMLSGIVAAQPFTSEMIGDESLSRRPMKRVMEPLRKMGAEISADRRPRPAANHRHAPEGHRLRRSSGQRAGQDLPAVRRPARRWTDHRGGADPHARSWRTGAARLWRGSSSLPQLCNHRGRPGAASARRLHPRRQLFGGVLPLCGGDFSRIQSRDRWRAAESHALGVARRADRHGMPRLGDACRGTAWRVGGHHLAGARQRASPSKSPERRPPCSSTSCQCWRRLLPSALDWWCVMLASCG